MPRTPQNPFDRLRDRFTPAAAALGLSPRSIAGKSARLLRGGDVVAARDLNAADHGALTIDSVRQLPDSNVVLVVDTDGDIHLVRGSRLVLLRRSAPYAELDPQQQVAVLSALPGTDEPRLAAV